MEKTIIEMLLREYIKKAKKTTPECDFDTRSFGDEIGIVISINQAQAIVDLISGNKG
jgi:hypothetical protein